MPLRIPSSLRLLKPLARQQFHFWGGLKVCRARHKADLRILMYHHFPSQQDELRRQCEHIRGHYHAVSMTQVSEATNGVHLPEQAVAFTVDDGYRDFLTNGFPVFREFGIPVTVYLVSDFLDRKQWLWWNTVQYAIENRRRSADLQIGGKTIDMNTAAVCNALKTLPNQERLESIQTLLREVEVSLPRELPDRWAPLNWDEVRQLSRENIEFGAHTKTHPILSSISDPQKLTDEIRGSKDRVEEELGAPVLHFCYPNGKNSDIGPGSLAIARQAGFRTAVTSEPGMNRLRDTPDPLQLRRLGASPDYPVAYFAELLAGVRSA